LEFINPNPDKTDEIAEILGVQPQDLLTDKK
jgi:hypothetical protein